MNIMASSSRRYSNTSTNAQLDSQRPHHQAPFAPQFELENHHYENDQMAFTMMNQANPLASTHTPFSNSINNDFMTKYGGGSYDFADFDQTFLFPSDVPATAVDQSTSSFVPQDHERQSSVPAGMRPLPTLNIFPSQPMHGRDPSSTSTAKVSATTILSPSSSASRRSLELSDSDIISNLKTVAPRTLAESSKAIKREGNKKGLSFSSGQDQQKKSDSKTLRRLAQNREAARKSRLRRKAYVQQLESSKMKLTQLEQELQKAKAQGVYMGGVDGILGTDQGVPLGVGHVSSEAAAFSMEYAKWLEDHRHRVGRLQAAVEQQFSENEIQFCVDNIMAHFDDFMHRKSMIVRADVFYIISGMWKTPAERCFLWIGGFRPSELIKIIAAQIKPLTEQQILGIIQLRNVMFEAEKNLSQRLQQLNQSLSEVIVSESLKSPNDIVNYMGQMAAGINKISEYVDIVNQADHLRLQAIHHVHGLMTTHQASRSLMAISEYFHRLRYLSSLWESRQQQS
uniref:transcription factor TGA2.3-like isoform X2 n=1 Tax=Erigeron canadensis TaxID=72917 RepID=UPI001CB8BF89|nr:transcription factor TGA2.3-like isoform X2 [Erigeron canadensis]